MQVRAVKLVGIVTVSLGTIRDDHAKVGIPV